MSIYICIQVDVYLFLRIHPCSKLPWSCFVGWSGRGEPERVRGGLWLYIYVCMCLYMSIWGGAEGLILTSKGAIPTKSTAAHATIGFFGGGFVPMPTGRFDLVGGTASVRGGAFSHYSLA